MPETAQIIEQINISDQQIDTDNTIDEQKIIQKIKETEDNFNRFSNHQLQDLQNTIPPEQFEKLKQNFNTLTHTFQSELDITQGKLSQLQHDEKEEYTRIIEEMQEKFWWALQIKQWDTLWDIAVKYLWLPSEWKLENYSWFEMVDILKQEQNIDDEKLQVWDVIIIPAEYTILKDIIKNNDVLDIKKLLQNDEIIYKDVYDTYNNDEKFHIDMILLKYFQAKQNHQKSDEIFEKILETGSQKQPSRKSLSLHPQKNAEDAQNFLDQKLSENSSEWKNYEGIWWYIEWLSDGFTYWVYAQLKSYADMLDGTTFNKILELLQDPIWIVQELYKDMKEEFWNIDLSVPYELWKTAWRLSMNIIIGMITWGAIWVAITGLSRFSKLTKLTQWLKTTQQFTKQMTGGIELKKINVLKNPNFASFKQLWIEALYHSWNWIIMTWLDIKKIATSLKWVKWVNSDGLKVIQKDGKDVLLIDPITIPGQLATRIRRYSAQEWMEPTVGILKTLMDIFQSQ